MQLNFAGLLCATFIIYASHFSLTNPLFLIIDEESKAQNGQVARLRSHWEPKALVLVLNLHVPVSISPGLSPLSIQLLFLLDEGIFAHLISLALSSSDILGI